MTNDGRVPLIDLISQREERAGHPGVREVLVDLVAEREEESGITRKLLAAWERLGRSRKTQLAELLQLEDGWERRVGFTQELAFELGFKLGAARARLERDEEVIGRSRELAERIASLLASENVAHPDALLALVAAARAILLEGRSLTDDT